MPGYNACDHAPNLGIFIWRLQDVDTLLPDPPNVMDYSRYRFVRGNPIKYNDPTGHFVETIWDAVNVGLGVASLGYNLWNGNYSDAAWDVAGLAVDVAATVIPVIPGGAATALKAGRAADAVVSVATHADEIVEITDDIQRFYHATNSTAASVIVENGIDLAAISRS